MGFLTYVPDHNRRACITIEEYFFARPTIGTNPHHGAAAIGIPSPRTHPTIGPYLPETHVQRAFQPNHGQGSSAFRGQLLMGNTRTRTRAATRARILPAVMNRGKLLDAEDLQPRGHHHGFAEASRTRGWTYKLWRETKSETREGSPSRQDLATSCEADQTAPSCRNSLRMVAACFISSEMGS